MRTASPLLLLFCLFGCFTTAFSQVPDLQWATGCTSKGGQEGNSVATDGYGNVYTFGLFTDTTDADPGPGVFSLYATGAIDMFLQKLDASGNFVWAKSFTGKGFQNSGKMVVDSVGTVYICGGFTDTVDFDPGPGVSKEISLGGYDIFMVMLDANGDLVWERTIQSVNNDVAYSIAVDTSGNVYATGIFADTVDMDPGPAVASLAAASGDLDAFVLKLNAAGEYQWAQRMGESASDLGTAIAVDAAGNVFSAGYFQGLVDFDPGTGTTGLTSFGVSDIFIQKLNTNGDFQWVRQIGGNSSDIAYSITTDKAGNILTTGFFSNTADLDPGPGTFPAASRGATDCFVLKLDTNGEFDWAKQLGGPASDLGRSITSDAAGNVYLAGYFQDTLDIGPGSSLPSQGNYDGFAVKLDPAGTVQWARNLGGSGQDLITGVSVDQSGFVYVTGGFTGIADMDPGAGTFDLATAPANYGIFTAKWGNCMPAYSTLTETVFCTDYTAPDGSIFTKSGDYTVSILNAAGCDSIITIHLTLHPAYSISLEDTICEGDSYTFNGTDYTLPSTYTANLATVYGCDSVITLHLAVLPDVTKTVNASICQGETFQFNGMDYGATGTYTADLQTTHGCDSTVKLELIVNQPADTLLTETICEGETVAFNGTDYGTAGSYIASLQTINGCDSTVTLNLAVNPSVNTILDETICIGEAYTFQGIDYSISDTLSVTLQQAATGCDSIVTLHLTVLPAHTASVAETICPGESFTFNGTAYSTPGAYPVVLQSVASGCDSTVTLQLTVNSVDTQVNQLNPVTLSASATVASYSWLNCDASFSPVGQAGPTFTAAANGNYAVEVTQNGCVDTSACFPVSEVGLTEQTAAAWSVYPVPARSELTIRASGTLSGSYFLYDQSGRLVMSGMLTGTETRLPINQLEAGMYTLRLAGDPEQAVKKIVKE